jgi:hypothetical protein
MDFARLLVEIRRMARVPPAPGTYPMQEIMRRRLAVSPELAEIAVRLDVDPVG